MVIVWLYLAFLITSVVAGVGVLAWGLYNVSRRARRLGGLAILGASALGALGALILYSILFLGSGGGPSNVLNEVGLLWAGAGFAWVGVATSLAFELKRLVSLRRRRVA